MNLPLDASNILPQAANEANQLLALGDYNLKDHQLVKEILEQEMGAKERENNIIKVKRSDSSRDNWSKMTH